LRYISEFPFSFVFKFKLYFVFNATPSQAIGACERLVQTPVPLTYARHTSRFLSIWCLTLPLALVGDFGFYTVPVMAVVTWALFGIQEIGKCVWSVDGGGAREIV
jgi:predicted membrane chloride channel (bestrophin family)